MCTDNIHEKCESRESELLEAIARLTDENKRLRAQYDRLQADNESLRSKTEVDSLAKVYNRSAAIEKIETVLAGDIESCSLIVLDIDNFKSINDSFGHAFGDTIIARAAECINSVIDSDSIPGRFGGDEFFVFMANTDSQRALETAENIILEFKEVSEPGIDAGKLSFSCGVSFCVGSCKFTKLFDMADKALYSAKHNGKAHAEMYDHNNMKSIDTQSICYFDTNDVKKNPHSDFILETVATALKAKTTDQSIYSIMRSMCSHFGIGSMSVLNVTMNLDMIEIVYEFKTPPFSDGRMHNKVGYYYHSDLVKFRDILEDRTIVSLSDEQLGLFSKKFAKELRSLNGSKRYVFLNKIDSEKYGICFFNMESSERVLTDDEKSAMTEITSIVFNYSDKLHYVTEKEREMQDALTYDKVTRAYTVGNFFIQSGYIRKVALENGMHCYLMYSKITNLREFNKIYSFDVGDKILKEFAHAFFDSEYNNIGIIARSEASFYLLVKSDMPKTTVKSVAADFLKMYIDKMYKLYPDIRLRISLGITEVFENERLIEKIDDAFYDKVPVEP